MSLYTFLKNELTRDYWLENDQEKFTERRKRVYSFMKIPIELEKFVIFGLLQCLDALLFTFTFLPIRFIKSIFKLFFYVIIKWRITSMDGSRLLNSAEICDFLKVMTLASSFFLLHHVDFSMVYHVIRGQTVIKLYIFFNMLDVADRLCSSFGQDILDSLFWTATGPRRRDHAGILPHFVLAIFYVFLHTILVLLQANTLNVAFNSHNKALLTIMISNNFLELKGSVFKRFEKANLFQMTCSDVRERFHLSVLLSIVVVRNLNQYSWDFAHFWVLLPDIMLVLVCELLVDWIKHAFITKFNAISFDVYREYSLSLAYDIVSSRNARAVSDHVDVVSRRMGFIPLPLAALISRVIIQSADFRSPFHLAIVLVFFFCLLSTKVLLSIILLGYAQVIVMYKRQVDALLHKEVPAVTASQLIASKDDMEIPKDNIAEQNGFRRSLSLGHFAKKDDEYDIIIEYKSASQEFSEDLKVYSRSNGNEKKAHKEANHNKNNAVEGICEEDEGDEREYGGVGDEKKWLGNVCVHKNVNDNMNKNVVKNKIINKNNIGKEVMEGAVIEGDDTVCVCNEDDELNE